jgi:ATP-dependent helicase Lhr and Lhr-like helicase
MTESERIKYKKKPNSESSVKRILNPLVEKWFYSRFKEFSLPQLYGILEIHSRNNVLISAPTGATKTLTGFMAILNELVDSSVKEILEDKVYCVYVSPLKALNNDIKLNLIEPLEQMEEIHGSKLGIRVSVRTGDTTTKERTAMLKNPPHILITTPESLGILLASPKFREHLRGVQWFIADEIHALAENKRGVHLNLSMERLAHLSEHMARVGLSATVAPLDEVAKYLVGAKRECKIVDVQFIKQMDLQVISAVPDLINISHEDMHTALYERMHELISKHKTTLVFTNTRAATERVVDHLKYKFPKDYYENIGAHHGSLSADHRTKLEQSLRDGKLKVVVCSTSLELGIDIGFIDLVICLGSPKSVARALQRIGRSGHQLHSVTKGRIIVMDRDDLIECSVLLKAAVEKKIDRIHLPKNALDVLAQHIYGMAIEEVWEEKKLFKVIKKSYCYSNLSLKDFNEVLSYLAGEFTSLEDRHVYAKIWRNEGKLGKRGRLARVIYMTNIGTIPDRTGIIVKMGTIPVGTLDEGFLERLRPGDVFILGGNTYTFRHAKGMVAFVQASANRPPTVPSWVSEMLPLSFDLSMQIGKFRRFIEDKFKKHVSKKEILKFINEYLYVDKNSALAIYAYFFEQYGYLGEIPNDKKIILEHYTDEEGKRKVVFHSLFGRRVNDVLSRAVAYSISRSQHKDVEIGLNDNGFYIGIGKGVQVSKAMKLIKSKELRKVMENAIEDSEVLRRRFRHCAGRALMILRNYMGRKKRVGRQQVSSLILLSAVKRISSDFSILREARREVLEDQMDIENATEVMKNIEEGKIKLVEVDTQIPSPFAFKIALQGVMDIVKMEDRMEFLQRMHQMVLAKILLNKNNKKSKSYVDIDEFSYQKFWNEEKVKLEQEKEDEADELKHILFDVSKKINLDAKIVYDVKNLIEGDVKFKQSFVDWLDGLLEPPINDAWPVKLINFLSQARERIK